jgi:hypothetical protein
MKPVLRQTSIRPVFSIASSVCLPLVAMMQSSDFGDSNHRSALRRLFRSQYPDKAFTISAPINHLLQSTV